ncbi:hypothetical protein C8R43DRAFT_1199999 [Mycena crocata]|nr:hypothetical protein C8R43DRAFT_1199999 [Mycena crocata]
MSPPRNTADARFENIVEYLNVGAAALRDLIDAFGTPFLKAIANTTVSLLVVAQSVKRNKDQCTELMEHVHTLLYAIMAVHVKSEVGGIQPPAVIGHIGKVMEAIQKVHVFVEAQQDGNIIRSFLRQSGNTALLNECKQDLQQALDVFKVDVGAGILSDTMDIQRNAQKTHEELVELLATLSDNGKSDRSISINEGFSSSGNSSISFSLLPGEPKIFHGRQAELKKIVEMLVKGSARIPILGPGGIGKTCLATAALHHPALASYAHRFFVSADSATTSLELAALIAANLELKAEKDSTQSIIHCLSNRSASLLILDNLETAWEPAQSRPAVEEFLSLLTQIPHLSLIITMRGAERPSRIQWTRPFPLPLTPLTTDAAMQTFMDITDDVHDERDVEQLLLLTDNVPLVIDLIAHLADYEGCPNVIAGWKKESIFLISEGKDRKSNLDKSITLSISSPRMAACPEARELLSLLSLLPDGLSDGELQQTSLPLPHILGCKSTLLLREYMSHIYPPGSKLIRPLRKYFQDILKLYTEYYGHLSGAKLIESITSNIGNLHNILMLGLSSDQDARDSAECTLALDYFNRVTNRGRSPLMDRVEDAITRLGDQKLRTQLITSMFMSSREYQIENPEPLIRQSQEHFLSVDDKEAECAFYLAAGVYYVDWKQDIPSCIGYYNHALSLAKSYADTRKQCSALNQMAWNLKKLQGSPQIYSRKQLQPGWHLMPTMHWGNTILASVCPAELGNF